MVNTEMTSPSVDTIDIGEYTLKEYVPAKAFESNLKITFTDANEQDIVKPLPGGQLNCGPTLKFPFALEGYLPTCVTIQEANELVTADENTHTKRVLELILDISALGTLDYMPGDTVGILPKNAKTVVEQLLQRLELSEQADSICRVDLSLHCAKKNAKVPGHIPATTTPREIFTHCLSLNAVPQKQFLSALAKYTSNINEREFLASLSSKHGAAHYHTLILEQGLCLQDLLELCPSCKPTLALLVEHLPRLLPRPYSIANSPLECSKHQLSIIFSIRAPKPGVTTSMLDALIAQHKQKEHQKPVELNIYPRMHNAFRYTEEHFTGNQILIAVGTGVAPFLGFLAHKAQNHELATGLTWLYMGAKTPQAIPKLDKLFEWHETGLIQCLNICTSRDSTEGGPKYVHELLEEDAETLVNFLLDPKTVLYVCADGAKISKSISQSLSSCLQQALELNETEAAQEIQEMRTKGKYREDLWI
ncbi:CG14882 [Drosophila busckii]|uniref:Methionine synthase reductase n=1 Tax=Drosophila busckii TaxID=30019 RepID=A0A0M4EW60_DROBS|nr:methionine synthase reductase [Drosophila busckii]XP_017847919.1 methionine synthase reductase [Drosophila busckii]ALC47717.1 CG14882 [Drosophila busckii]